MLRSERVWIEFEAPDRPAWKTSWFHHSSIQFTCHAILVIPSIKLEQLAKPFLDQQIAPIS